jgi:hypothetical protein
MASGFARQVGLPIRRTMLPLNAPFLEPGGDMDHWFPETKRIRHLKQVDTSRDHKLFPPLSCSFSVRAAATISAPVFA